MLLGRVLGRVWADRQLPALGGRRFVLVEDESTGARIVAVDLVDSGRGATVLVATDEAAQAAAGEQAVDAAVVALVANLDEVPEPRSAPVSGNSRPDSTHHSRPPGVTVEAAP